MSEAFPNISFELPIAKPKDAAVVVLVRELGPGKREIFWVRRGGRLEFAGGFYAFPGGKVERSDAETMIDNCPQGEEAIRVAAIRETFEEIGVLLAPGGDQISSEKLAVARKSLLDGSPFSSLLKGLGLNLDASILIDAGRWVTPRFSPIRFDARFYMVRVAAHIDTEILPGELSGGGWIDPAEGLALWEQGQVLLHPPNRHVLSVLAGNTSEAAIPRLRTPPFVDPEYVVHRIEFQRGVHILPLRTPTLPPAQHTNCWLVGTGDFVIIDPGSPRPEEQQRLAELVSEFISEGGRPIAVLLTHHHIDHVGGARALAERFNIPIRSSAATAQRVPGAIGDINDGDIIELDGPMPMRLECVLTEGHAQGHLCFIDQASRAIFAGDMVASGTTIVIDPPEGNMGVYLNSLQRLTECNIGTIYPAHGFPIPDGPKRLDHYLTHRRMRLDQISSALEEAGPMQVEEIVALVYQKTPEFLHPAAARSALASLIELQERGVVTKLGNSWESST